jgi:5-methylthioribose kinase
MLAQLPVAYHEMTENRLSRYLAGLPEIAARLGNQPALWQISDVESGDLDLVFMIEGPSGDACVKQALAAAPQLDEPLILPLERMDFEEAALTLYGRLASGLAPRIIHFDSELALLVMERLHPHVTLRRAMMRERVLPRLVEQISRFLAEMAFHTSDLGTPAEEKRERVAFFCGNASLCQMTEYLAFVEPYDTGADQRWNTPQLDDLAREVRGDHALKQRLASLQHDFLTTSDALIHGHLTTDAVLVTETDTKVVNPAFACYGPIGFDVGTLIGHLLMGYFSQPGLAPEDSPRSSYEQWLLETVIAVWQGFRDRFVGLWNSVHTGDAFPKVLFLGSGGGASLIEAQNDFMARVLIDALRFAGVAIVRATLGRHHAAEFEAIEDPERRARCERWAIALARELIKDAHYVEGIEQVADVARQIREGTIPDG